MRTPEEIKRALEYEVAPCAGVLCEECEYKAECNDVTYGRDDAVHDAIALIKRMERDASDALATIAQLEETICLMKIQMRGDCGCCKHGRDGDMKRCNECLLSREYHPLWEYEGLPEVEVYEQSEMPVLR